MNWFKRNPLLGAVLVICTLAIGVEAWLLQQARVQAARSLAALEQKKQDRDWLARQSPAPSEANEQAIARELELARSALASLRAGLKPRDGKVVANPPDKPIDAYFDIAAFVEKTRGTAARAQVMIKPDERFGFATHVNEGPDVDLVPAVFRQRLMAQQLVEALLEARPRVLVAVQRERPQTTAQRTQRNEPAQAGTPTPATTSVITGGGLTTDFFDFPAQDSLRVPGRVESEVFRLEFTGQTPALRALLNSLAALPVPAIVRRVEVEPLATDSAPAASPVEGAPVPLVPQNLSKFAVTVECVELLASAGPSAP